MEAWSSGKKRPRPFESQQFTVNDDNEMNDQLDMQISSDSEMESTIDETIEPFYAKAGRLEDEASIYNLVSGTLFPDGETCEVESESTNYLSNTEQTKHQPSCLSEELKGHTVLMQTLLRDKRLAPFGIARGMTKWPLPLKKLVKSFPEYRASDPAICELSDGLYFHRSECATDKNGKQQKAHPKDPLFCPTHPPPELLRAFRRVFLKLKSKYPGSLPEEPSPAVITRICQSTAKIMELVLYGFFRRMTPSYFDAKVRNRRTPLNECKTILSLCEQLGIPDAVLDRTEARMGEVCKAFCKQRDDGVTRELHKRGYPLVNKSPFSTSLLVGDDMANYLAAFPKVFAFFPYQAEPLCSVPAHWCDSCQAQLIRTLLNSNKILETVLCGPDTEKNVKSELINRSQLMIPMSRKAFRASLGQMKFSKPSCKDAYFQSRIPPCLLNILPVAVASFFRDVKLFAVNLFGKHTENDTSQDRKSPSSNDDSNSRKSATQSGSKVNERSNTNEERDASSQSHPSHEKQVSEEAIRQGVLSLEMSEACAKYMPYKNIPRTTLSYQEKREMVEDTLLKRRSRASSDSQSNSAEEKTVEQQTSTNDSASQTSSDENESSDDEGNSTTVHRNTSSETYTENSEASTSDNSSSSSNESEDSSSEYQGTSDTGKSPISEEEDSSVDDDTSSSEDTSFSDESTTSSSE